MPRRGHKQKIRAEDNRDNDEVRPKVGIVTSDPLIAFAVYREVIAQTPAYRLQDHIDAVVYTRKLENSDRAFDMFEGTHALKRVGCSTAVFPETMDESAIKGLNGSASPQVKLYAFKGLQPITPSMLEGIRENIRTKTPPPGPPLSDRYAHAMELIAAWAQLCLNTNAKKQNDQFVVAEPTSKRAKDEIFLKEASDPNRFKNTCFVGVHGGMGPDSGNDAMYQLACGKDAAVAMMSACSTPNAAEFIMDIVAHKMEHVGKLLDPYPKIKHARELLARLNPDSVIHACNTAHYFDDRLRSDGYTGVNIVEETVKRLPANARVLILGTTATVKSGLYAQAIDRADRQDVQLIKPRYDSEDSLDYQEIVNNVIWRQLMSGNYDQAAKTLNRVIKKYFPEGIGDNCYVLCACTEVIFGIGKELSADKLIDPMKIGIDVAARQASDAQQMRKPRIDLLSRAASAGNGHGGPG